MGKPFGLPLISNAVERDRRLQGFSRCCWRVDAFSFDDLHKPCVWLPAFVISDFRQAQLTDAPAFALRETSRHVAPVPFRTKPNEHFLIDLTVSTMPATCFPLCRFDGYGYAWYHAIAACSIQRVVAPVRDMKSRSGSTLGVFSPDRPIFSFNRIFPLSVSKNEV